MYNYLNPYNRQADLDRINAQMNELEKIRSQMQQPIQQPTNLTQNFQLAPTSRDVIRYANNIEEVQRDLVMGDTPYFSKDMSVVWIKNTKGEIKAYTLAEIVQKDEKDMQIEYLQAQIEELKGMVNNESNDEDVSNDDAKQSTTDTTTNGKLFRTTTKKSKPTSI